MRTDITHRHESTRSIVTENDRQPEHLRPLHRARAQGMTGHGRVPEANGGTTLRRCNLGQWLFDDEGLSIGRKLARQVRPMNCDYIEKMAIDQAMSTRLRGYPVP